MNRIDSLRYELADALYRGEGRYGTLEGQVRLLDWRHGDDPRDWPWALAPIRAEVTRFIGEEFDEGRMAGLRDSLRLLDELLAEIAGLDAEKAWKEAA